MAPSLLQTLVLFCLCGGASSGESTPDNHEIVTASVGQNATIHCIPRQMPQDGVYMHKQLFKEETITYLYKDGTFTPREAFHKRLDTNRHLNKFSVTIIDVTLLDTGIYWCVFNKEDNNSFGKQKTLLVVSGKQEKCTSEAPFLSLIIVCIAASFVILLITIILLWTIPKLKHCCERGKFTPPQQPGDGVYEEMHGRRAPTAHTLINPAYQTSRQLHSTGTIY